MYNFFFSRFSDRRRDTCYFGAIGGILGSKEPGMELKDGWHVDYLRIYLDHWTQEATISGLEEQQIGLYECGHEEEL
jgi:hypothetical protein